MAFKVGIGKSDFEDLRSSGSYYVDKTGIIYELVEETNNEVTLFTRPRRFGKTLTMSMLENFFSIRKDSAKLFEGLDIAKREEFCAEWMNRYPVLFISFKDVEDTNFDDAYKMLKMNIADLCKKISDIAKNESVDPDDRDTFARLKARTADKEEVKNFIKILMRMMYNVYGRQVILLIDEYDVPLAQASEYGTEDRSYYRNMLNVIRGIMGKALKDNEYLKFAVITGCLRVAKESIFTGTNNFAAYTVIDEDFSEYFGFTQNEVNELLIAVDCEDKADIVKEWYDGYLFGNSNVYCPWDVINHISAIMRRKDAEPENYWMNTSHNGIVVTFANNTKFDVAVELEDLMNGKSVTRNIVDDITYDTINSSEDNLWSILLMTGYLTKATIGGGKNGVELKIPNREIDAIFEKAIVRLFRETIDNRTQRLLMQALWEQDENAVSNGISDMLWKTISYHNYSEAYYHAFLAGVFSGLGYIVDSDKEYGLGRPDIVLKDKSNRRAVIIEAKRSADRSDMERDCEAARKQIIERQYAEDEGFYGYEQIICYGISFFKKKALVKSMMNKKEW